jgi:hypothetical protein
VTIPTAKPLEDAAATLSRLRGRRILHPYGVGLRGSLTPLDGRLAGTPLGAATEVTARLSRSLGLPEPLPEPLGLAFRVADAFGPGRHQDVLLTTCGQPPYAHRLLAPASRFSQRAYSSVLPYRLHGARVILEAEPAAGEGPGPTLAELRAGGGLPLSYVLGVRTSARRSEAAARLRLEERIDPDQAEGLAFDPLNTGGGLELVGLINRLRGPTYRGSQEGRGAAT